MQEGNARRVLPGCQILLELLCRSATPNVSAVSSQIALWRVYDLSTTRSRSSDLICTWPGLHIEAPHCSRHTCITRRGERRELRFA